MSQLGQIKVKYISNASTAFEMFGNNLVMLNVSNLTRFLQ